MSIPTIKTFTIKNDLGLIVKLADYGARIVSIELAGQYKSVNVACGYADIQDYLEDDFYMGATIGPIANRIADGKLNIENREYQLPQNHGDHCLHGGDQSFDMQTWKCEHHDQSSVEFSLVYGENPESLPGNLKLLTRYSLTGQQLKIEYEGQTDKATYINLSNHVYLNLNGEANTIHDHEFALFSDAYAQVDDFGIPSGERQITNNPLSYSLNGQSAYPDLQDKVDHHFIVDEDDSSLKAFAYIKSQSTGISVLMSSTKPGLQFYTGQFLSEPFKAFQGFCIESQFAPDAINQENFISPLTTPKTPYYHQTTFVFDWPI
ncbi:MAG: aldose 1-epimerase [Dinoroseobacter sp.]|jgi:aldose 1-epimerase